MIIRIRRAKAALVGSVVAGLVALPLTMAFTGPATAHNETTMAGTKSTASVSTVSVSNVTSTSATASAIVDASGGDATVFFQYGKTTKYGSRSAKQTVSGTQTVSKTLSGLTADTLYYVRVVARNSAGTTYSVPAQFTTTSTSTSSSSTTSSTSSTTTTTTPPTSTTTTTSNGSYDCTAQIGDACGAYSYAGIPNSNGYNTYISNQAVNVQSGTTQTVYANSPSDWKMVSDSKPYGFEGVQTYPDIQQLFNNWCGSIDNWSSCQNPTDTPVASLPAIKINYKESSPKGTNDIYQFSPDVWLDNYGSDIMFWVDVKGRCNEGAFGNTVLGHATIDGQNWTVHRYNDPGDEIIFVLDGPGGSGTCAQQSEGTINVKAGIEWLQSKGFVPAGSNLTQLNTGWEVTSAENATFQVSGYSIDLGSGTPTTTTSTTSTTTTTPPSTTTTTGASGSVCTNPYFTTSDPNGGVSDGGYYVHNNLWNANNYPGTKGTTSVCSFHSWNHVGYAVNNGDGAVKTYPNVHKDLSGRSISSFTKLTSDFAAVSPNKGIYNVAYDLWLNGVPNDEVMIWTDNYKQVPAGSRFASNVSLSGYTWDVYATGDNGYIAFVPSGGARLTSGTVDLRAMLNYLVQTGHRKSSDTVDQICYGVEIVDTGGSNATWNFTNFNLNMN